KIKSIISVVLVLMLSLSTIISANTPDEAEEAGWSKKVDDNGKATYHNTKTGVTIAQAFTYNENGELVEVSLDEAMPNILESKEKAEDKKNKIKIIEKKDEIDDVILSGFPYHTYNYNESVKSTVTGAAEKITPDVAGPTPIQYGTSSTFTDSFSLSISLSGEVEDAIEAGAGFGWETSASNATTFGVVYQVPAGSYGAVYFAPYYNYTRGTLTVYTHTGGIPYTDVFYNQSAKSPKTLYNGDCDGFYWLELN
ncbi:hypothetical protein, partial [Petrocella sp. FN5]|uniref:hypothetical protein n=1 Tax=Petrocella sp. FN5 TaxID=3032002 RepID=UPI0023DB8F9B